MRVVDKNKLPDGTVIQIEDWKSDYPGTFNTLTIAAYPIAKNTSKYMWVRKGEIFRLELLRGFKTDEYVKDLFEKLVNGTVKLEDLSDHFWDRDKSLFYMGLKENEE